MLMAKRPTPRSKTPDPAAPAEPKPKRARRGAPAESSAPASVASTADDSASAEPTNDDIRRRAYERYLERGGNHGRHFDDWLEAEKELRSRK
jgi:hypothetical protein